MKTEPGRRDSVTLEYTRFRHDAARWIWPEQIAPIAEVTPLVAARLLMRHPPLRAMAWFRLACAARACGVRGVPSYVQRRLLRLYGLEIAPSTPVDGGLYIAHPVGCVLHAAEIGANVTVIGQVTFGTLDDPGWPSVRDGAYFGIGARVLGDIEIGPGATVGANAVVLRSVDAGTTVVGVPARPLPPRVERQ